METACKLRIKPSLAFLNSCIRALAEHGDLHGAFHVMDRICALEGVVPDAFSYNSLIYALVQEPWVSQVITDVLLMRCYAFGPRVVYRSLDVFKMS